jgi:xanthosine utilization system XapX-like protein
MNALIYVFVATITVAAVLATIAIWAPRAPRVRLIALAATVLFIPLGYVQLVEMLARPKPVSFEWFRNDVEQAQVLGASLDEGRAIYLWLRVDKDIEPRYYVLPWRQDTAEKLEDLIDNAVRNNATIVLRQPFIRKFMKDQGELNANIVPPPLPPQKMPTPPPQIFNPRKPNI